MGCTVPVCNHFSFILKKKLFEKMRVSVACVLCIFGLIFLSFTTRTEASISPAEFDKILKDLQSLNEEFDIINSNYKTYKTAQSEAVYQKEGEDDDDDEEYED